ncbi:uncharacterized protein TrAFT101_003495 [Trichoderma asperellum]|uniref:uncharacterized protein n=1 Tax=Trichoderma asperellum TaxID=101201 RepID=UPI00333347F8|nr:hypothetical protein TrAFT101_003495 [Trichoderma asperellum]
MQPNSAYHSLGFLRAGETTRGGPVNKESSKQPLVDLRLAFPERRRLHRVRYAEQKRLWSSVAENLDLSFRQIPESAGRCPSHGYAWASWHMQLCSRTVPQLHDDGWDVA